MLVLTREPGQRITVKVGDQELTITYIERNGGDQISLGFDGPRCFDVTRDNAKVKVPRT